MGARQVDITSDALSPEADAALLAETQLVARAAVQRGRRGRINRCVFNEAHETTAPSPQLHRLTDADPLRELERDRWCVWRSVSAVAEQ